MRMGYLLRSTNLWGLADLIRERGGDPDDLFARHGIRPGIELEDDAFVPIRAFSRLLEATAAELGVPDLGLRLSGSQGLDILGPIAVIARNSATVREAWEAIARYLYVHSPSLSLAEAGPGHPGIVRAGEIVYDFRIDDPGTPYSVQTWELSLANGARILQLLGGTDCLPARVAFLHPRLGPEQSYRETFGAEPIFQADWCGLALPDRLAGRPVDHADAGTRQLATRYLEERFLPEEHGIAPRVAELVRRLLPTGHCDAATVAEHLQLHPRTLQRRLAAEGTRFADVLDAERRDQSRRLLAHHGLHLGQVAAMLGYSEQSAFTRAFGRWYGVPPGKFRGTTQDR